MSNGPDEERAEYSRVGDVREGPDGERVLWRIPAELSEFIIIPQIVRGVGSSRINLDRGQPGSLRHVRIVRTPRAVVLEQQNTHFLTSGDRDPSVAEGFARSMLAHLPVVEASEEAVVVDVSSFMLQDVMGIGRWFAVAGITASRVDTARSRILFEETYSHEAGVELSSDLVFLGLSGDAAKEVLPDEETAIVTQRITFFPMPQPPLEPRRYDPSSGGYGKRFADHSLPIDGSLASGWQPRFRASPERPVVFTVDPNVPSPWLEDFVDGGNYWQAAFESAGLAGAYRVEAGKEDEDLARAGTNTVWWVHRTGRGWSRAAALTDPRSGEILKASVRLGSQRLQQLTQIGEALLTPYGRPDEEERLRRIREMVRARIRLLAAHEIGHAIGFMHNYAITGHETTSIMDYPHMRVRLDERGEIDFSDGYATGASEWDRLMVCMAYGSEQVAREAAERVRELGLRYITDADGHGVSASVPEAVPWVIHTDARSGLAQILEVRAKAMADFGRGAAPRDVQAGELEKRYAIVHLLHRFQANGVARFLGGVSYEYGSAGDPRTAPVPVPVETQREALRALADAVRPEVVRVPEHVVDLLPPPSIRFERSGADFASFTAPLFDPLTAATAAVRCVIEPALEPNRLNRLRAAHDRDGAPAPTEVLEAFLAAASERGDALQEEMRRTMLTVAIASVRSGALHAIVERELRALLSQRLGEGDEVLSDALAHLSAPLPALPPLPEGQPI